MEMDIVSENGVYMRIWMGDNRGQCEKNDDLAIFLE